MATRKRITIEYDAELIKDDDEATLIDTLTEWANDYREEFFEEHTDEDDDDDEPDLEDIIPALALTVSSPEEVK